MLLGVVFVVAMLSPLFCLLLYSFADRFSATAALPPAYSLRWYQEFVQDPRAIGAMLTSLLVASSATLIALGCGVPACWALARHRLRGRSLIEGTILLRTAVPVIVIGLGSAAVLYSVHQIDRYSSLILAHSAGALPFVVWAVRPAFAGLDVDLDTAARDLGAGPVRRFYLALREVSPALIVGALFAFLFSLDEFAVTFLIAGQRVVTLPIVLYGALESNSVQAAAAVAVVLLIPSLGIAAIGVWLLNRAEGLLGVGFRR